MRPRPTMVRTCIAILQYLVLQYCNTKLWRVHFLSRQNPVDFGGYDALRSDTATPTNLAKMSSRAWTPIFEADLKKQGTRLKGWATRRCTVANKTLSYTHRFGGSHSIILTRDTFINLDDCDVRITVGGEHDSHVFRAPTRRLAMQLQAALLQEIGWQKSSKAAGMAMATFGSPVPYDGDDAVVRGVDALEHALSLRLCQAAADGMVDTIKSLAPTREDVNSTVTGSTPLNWACFEGKTECVTQLLQLGASLDVEDHTRMVPAETCVFLANKNKRKTLAILARAQHERRGGAHLFAEIVYRLQQRHPDMPSMAFQRIIIDFGLGRQKVDTIRNSSYRVFCLPSSSATTHVRCFPSSTRRAPSQATCACVNPNVFG